MRAMSLGEWHRVLTRADMILPESSAESPATSLSPCAPDEPALFISSNVPLTSGPLQTFLCLQCPFTPSRGTAYSCTGCPLLQVTQTGQRALKPRPGSAHQAMFKGAGSICPR